MKLQDEALEYWKTVSEYRKCLTEAGRTYIAHIQIPTLHLRASNPRIINQLFNIMSLEGVPHVEDQPTNSGV